MAEIYIHGNPINSIFELLGDKENDITFSIGWVLANCPSFLTIFIKKILSISGTPFGGRSIHVYVKNIHELTFGNSFDIVDDN